MSDQKRCPFCQIVRGEAPAEIVCEAEDWLAFFPDTPAVSGHTLVIPRRHVPNFLALEPALGSSLMAGVVRIGRAIETALQPRGMNLISSAGDAADQSVFHLHLHVVPRQTGDRIGRIWPPDKPIDEEVKEDVADLIRDACSAQE